MFSLAVQLDHDASEDVADRTYKVVTEALKATEIRFAAQLQVVPTPAETEVRSAMSTLWSGGDLGG